MYLAWMLVDDFYDTPHIVRVDPRHRQYIVLSQDTVEFAKYERISGLLDEIQL